MSNKTKTLGIDLGTTYSVIAQTNENGVPQALISPTQEMVIPSTVYINDGEILVGSAANRAAVGDWDNHVERIKDLMGSDFTKTLGGRKLRPEEISALILKKIIGDVDSQCSMSDLATMYVVTVPAYYGLKERKATQDAAILAAAETNEARLHRDPAAPKLKFGGLLDEPVAAGLDYLRPELKEAARGVEANISFNGSMVVFDFGGGTLDVAIIKCDGKLPVECVAVTGDRALGGKLFDERLRNFAADEFCAANKVERDDFDSDRDAWMGLLHECEQAKRALTQSERAKIAVSFQGARFSLEVTREKFGELTMDLLDRSAMLLQQALVKAENWRSSAGEACPKPKLAVLVGGSSLMPQVAERVMAECHLERAQIHLSNPHLAVANGAAIFAHFLAKGWQQPVPGPTPSSGRGAVTTGGEGKLVFKTVTPHSYGIVAVKSGKGPEQIFNLIVADSKLPASQTRPFYTLEHECESVELRVMQNHSKDKGGIPLEDGLEIGRVVLQMPPNSPAGHRIDVTFEFTDAALLNVRAVECSPKRLVVEGSFEPGTVAEPEPELVNT